MEGQEMKKLLTLLTACAFVFALTPVKAQEPETEVCVLEYNEDGTIKNEEEYLKCLEEHSQVVPYGSKENDPKK